MPADAMARVRAVLEEELGEVRPLADLPARDIEAIAARLARALAPVLGPAADRRDAA